jgi:hypothetical protein
MADVTYTQEQVIEGSKTSYYKTLALMGLAGGLLGGWFATGIAKEKTLSTVLAGNIAGGLITLFGYGIYLRTGGLDLWRNPLVPEERPEMAGLGALAFLPG